MNLPVLAFAPVPRSLRALCCFLVLTPACVASHANAVASPRETLAAVQRAAAQGDWSTLYAALPERARGAESSATFRARMEASRADLTDLSRDIGAALRSEQPVVVELPGRGGTPVTVVDEASDWRMLDPGIGPAPAATPRAAVRQFRSALQRGGAETVLATLSARMRGGMHAEIAGLVEATAAPDTLPIRVDGSSAEVVLPDGRRLHLVREGTREATNWRVDEVL